MLQAAYQIQVMGADGLLWDSGRVESREQSFVEYQGAPLSSRTAYLWQITVWDNQGEEGKAASTFETAFLFAYDWKAKWIESSIPRIPVKECQMVDTAPPVLFEKSFCLKAGIRSARLYATCYGIYRLWMNGKRPDDREFAPEFTAYGGLLYYQTYDVSGLIRSGENTLAMYVGDGWYFSRQARPVGACHERQAVLFQLEVVYEDGSTSCVCSDGSESCALGAICYSDLFQGEK